MTQIDQIIADALAGIPETDVAILAREVVRLREARVVVVPPHLSVREIKDEIFFRVARGEIISDSEANALGSGIDRGYKIAISRIDALRANQGGAAT